MWRERNRRHFIEQYRKKRLDRKVGEFSSAKSGQQTKKLMKGQKLEKTAARQPRATVNERVVECSEE